MEHDGEAGAFETEAERQLREETRSLQTLNRLASRLAAELDLQALVQAATDAATELTGAQFGAFFYNVLDATGESYMLYTLSGVPREAFARFPMPRNTQVFSPTFSGSTVVRVADIQADPRYGHNPPHHGMPAGHLPVRSYLAVPVVSRGGEVLGGLFFGHAQPGVFDDRAELIATGIASQAAVGIDNARLFERARQSEAHYRVLVDTLPQLIWTCTPAGACDYLSRQWLEYTGVPAAEQLGDGWLDLVHVEDRDRVSGAWSRTLHDQAAYDVEFRIRGADGEYRWFQARAHPLRRDDASVDRWFGTCTDIHDRKLAEFDREELLASERTARSELEKANRLKDEFLATLSHELRTPLNAVLGWATILRKKYGANPELLELIEPIERNARAQTQLIDDLLDMSRITSGKLRLAVQVIDAATVIEAAMAVVRPAAAAKSLRLTQTLDPSAGPVNADPSRLQQIIWNLLTNAIKFTPKGGRIHVVLQRINSHVELTVRDNGEGIGAEFLPHIFERFRQQDSSVTRSHSGLGLGLAIVKQLVELHGGTVRATSAGTGMGATFTVLLPLTAIQVRDARVPAPSKRTGLASDDPDCVSLAGIRVLIVDDDADSRELARLLIVGCGAQVVAVASAREALEQFDIAQPDVLVSDVGMPLIDGYDLIKQVRSLGLDAGGATPAVAMTALARPEDRRRAILAGFQAHVAKPVDAGELIAVLAMLVGRIGPRR
jgi:PAS domain S-box-containing protein